MIFTDPQCVRDQVSLDHFLQQDIAVRHKKKAAKTTVIGVGLREHLQETHVFADENHGFLSDVPLNKTIESASPVLWW